MRDSRIERAWSNILNPGGLGSLTNFARNQKTSKNLRQLEKSLSRIEAFSRHRRQENDTVHRP